MKRFKKLIAWSLSFSIFAGSFPAAAAEPFRGAPYAISCEGLLEALKSGEIDSFLLGQAKTDAEKAQLLYDYQLIFNQKFQEAILLALREIQIDRDAGRKPLLKFIRDLKALTQRNDESFALFTRSVLKHLKDLHASAPEENVARVHYLRTKRIIEAIEKSGNRDEIEKVMGTAVRMALLLTLKDGLLQESKDGKSSGKWLLGGTVIGLAIVLYFFGEMPGYHTYSYYGYKRSSYEMNYFLGWNFFMTFLGAAGSFMSSAFLGSMTTKMRAGGQAAAINVSPEAEFNSGKLKVTVQDLFEKYEEEAKLGILSVREACKKDICELTPVEIAYLGHLDILDIKALMENSTGDVRPSNIARLITVAQSEATNLQATPGAYRAHMKFMGALNEIITLFTVDEEKRAAAVQALVERIDETTKLIEELTLKPYSYRVQDLTEERLQKNEMLIEKLNSDIATLQAMRFDQNAFDGYLKKIKPFVERLKDRLQPMPRTPGQWKSAAEEAALILDQMKVSLAP